MATPVLKNPILMKAVKKLGSQTKLAAAINTTQQNIWWWLYEANSINAEFVIAIEKASGVSRHELRPDIYPKDEAA
ncbi:MAG: helix-turn-helix domain-containing protein [Alteromonadaceae bacterium]|nr:helix-turn-helix domain-containing protein [Alteromonadaceae bacterium]